MDDLGVGPHCIVIDLDVTCAECGGKLKNEVITRESKGKTYRYHYGRCYRCGARRRR